MAPWQGALDMASASAHVVLYSINTPSFLYRLSLLQQQQQPSSHAHQKVDWEQAATHHAHTPTLPCPHPTTPPIGSLPHMHTLTPLSDLG